MKKIALIGCTSDKLDGPCPAIEIYTKSSYFKSKLKYCEKINVDEIFILSAKYGFLKPDEIIEYYDETLKGKPKDHKIKWTNKVLNDLKENCDIENDKFVILAGNDYTKYLLEHLNNYYNPVKGLGIGSQHNYFNTVSKDTINALRVSILNDSYEDTVAKYQKEVDRKDSQLSVQSVTIGNKAKGMEITANRYTGTIPRTDLSGYIVIFKIRDKSPESSINPCFLILAESNK